MYTNEDKVNIGSSIEQIIELLMKMNSEYANLTSKVQSLENRLAAVSVLIDINEYMGNILSFSDIISYLKDVIAGVLGLDCKIYTPAEIAVLDLNPVYLTSSELYLPDITASSEKLFGYGSGCLGIINLSKRGHIYGYLVIHHKIPDMINEDKKALLQLIKSQICIYFENADLFSKVRDSAERDGLTGLYNRLFLSQLLDDWKNKMSDINGAIILDIDNFKAINDKYGHLNGDNVINMLVQVIRDATVNLPVLAIRYGGEEFLLLTRGMETGDMLSVAENIRSGFNSLKFQESGLSVSVGVSVLGQSCKVIDYMELIHTADSALYTAKKIGKNRVVLSEKDSQLFDNVSFDITKYLSKYNRFNTAGGIYRINFNSARLLSTDEYGRLKRCIASCFREYDNIYDSVSLAFVILSDNEIPLALMTDKIQKALMLAEFDFLSFDMFSHSDAYREIMLHSERVAAISTSLAEAYGLSEEECCRVRLAAANHDVGKLYIDPGILNKPGKLTQEEFGQVKMHAFYSYQYAQSRENLKEVADYILYHHECIDGSGYFGKKDIPVYSQIIMVADIFDALTENRCYRKAYTRNEAIEIMEKERYKFDKGIFDLLKQMHKYI
ncbi:cyclic di-GMP phosphodiesterase response regulator RpfG [Ruminiclostridium hungatei]|uniref:Cyclic di-GMP phosphodiesterase response regulator RpfG n=1 Tax=Ruminiclostridium hungatei TaxID=48256 RepID=A0A1V4SN95_RUMHU|nr:diguanylate cyclase [Ruminiclostridium hungatei]OPX44946.1 cyclic di-GMP phosphodiesterase response regulator RpfG [Ruminiclostridium hungatei]